MRTDRTSLCTACRVRFARSRTCPTCSSGAAVYDTLDEASRARAVARLHGGSRYRRTRGWAGLDPAAEAPRARRIRFVVGTVLLVSTFSVPLVASEVLGVTAGVGAIVGAAMLWVLARQLRGLRREEGGLELDVVDVPRPPPRSDVEVIRGRVRIVEAAIAPLSSRPCAAFRITGTAHGGVVDDAGGGVFDVVRDGEEPVRIALGPATVDLPIEVAPVPVDPTAALARFLDQRGVSGSLGPATLAEAVLVEDDPVEITAVIESTTRPSGYRSTEPLRVARDRRDAPLTIRRAHL